MSQKYENGNMMNDQVTWLAHKPYNDLPPLPPRVDLETRRILKQCINARVALAELKQAAELIPNQAMLINTIPMLEARDSSETLPIRSQRAKRPRCQRNTALSDCAAPGLSIPQNTTTVHGHRS
jgi:hypothetical protein